MDVVVLHHVIMGKVAGVAPVEADTDAHRIEIRYLIVLNENIVGIANHNAKAHNRNTATPGNQVVADIDVLRHILVCMKITASTSCRPTDADASAARVGDQAIAELREIG